MTQPNKDYIFVHVASWAYFWCKTLVQVQASLPISWRLVTHPCFLLCTSNHYICSMWLYMCATVLSTKEVHIAKFTECSLMFVLYLYLVAGVKPGKLVEAHGTFSTASCISCKSKQDPELVKVSSNELVILITKFWSVCRGWYLIMKYLDVLTIIAR